MVRIEILVQCSVAACDCDDVHRLVNDSALTSGAIRQDRRDLVITAGKIREKQIHDPWCVIAV